MPAYARGPPPDTGAWRNEPRYSSSGGPTHLQPPSGPSRGMAPQLSTSLDYPVLPVQNALAATSTSIPEPPAIPTFSHIPYFTAIQLETLYARRRGARMSASIWHTNRDVATGFIQSVASRLGFPQRTIATAQQIYQRFHLFYPPSDFVLHEIAVASLFVAAKLNDTHKKPRDLLLASYALRFPQLVKGNSSASDTLGLSTSKDATFAEEPNFPTLAGQKRKHAAAVGDESASPKPLAMAIGSVGEADIDPNILESDRKRLMALEKLILESLCFNFHTNANVALKMVIKLGRRSQLPKSFIRTAWKVAADMFRTSAPMQYSPNVIAVASLYAAALLARPPPRTNPTSERGSSSTEQSEQDDDTLSAFLSSLRSVSSAPAPDETSTAEDARQIPLSEPFPGCDAECRVHVEDVEEAVHELLDLYLACTAQLPPSLYMTSASGFGPSHGHSGSAAATPSPLSPADPLDVFNASPSSSGGLSDPASQQPASARKKLKQYEYSPPPFGLVDWLNSSRCTQLQSSQPSAHKPEIAAATHNGARKTNVGNQAAGSVQGNVDPTLPTKELSALLTDLKIYLRGIEYGRQRADDSFLAGLNILAHVQVVPLLEDGLNSDAAVMQSIGMAGVAAHSMAIQLQPLDEAQSANAGGRDLLAELDETTRGIVERIRRRKLVCALRLTFIEPEVERRPNLSPIPKPQPDHQPYPTPSSTTKRNRIEQAKRYLF